MSLLELSNQCSKFLIGRVIFNCPCVLVQTRVFMQYRGYQPPVDTVGKEGLEILCLSWDVPAALFVEYILCMS